MAKQKPNTRMSTLTAPQVGIDQQTQVLTAVNKKDSTGAVTEEAIF